MLKVTTDFASTIKYLLLVVFEGVIIYKVVRYLRIVSNNEYAKQEFIKKNDTDSYMALYEYATTEKPMLHVTKKVTFNNPVQMVSIDLNLKDSNE